MLRGDVSYLIIGGTGGIGRAICQWMAQRGAKNVILASRSGNTNILAKSMVAELSSIGVMLVLKPTCGFSSQNVQRQCHPLAVSSMVHMSTRSAFP